MAHQASDNEMRRRLAYAVKSRLQERMSATLHKAVLFTLMFASSSLYGESIPSDKTPKTHEPTTSTPTDVRKNLISGFGDLNVNNLQLLDAETAHHLLCSSDARLDLSHTTFSMDDFSASAKYETPITKQIQRLAVQIRTPKGHCTKHAKNLLRRLGFVKNLSPQQQADFERIDSAWGLLKVLPYMKELVEVPMDSEDEKCKTTPTVMLRVNEKGETRYSHIQVMGPRGACFGNGWEASPDCHIAANGRRQNYGKAHFYMEHDAFVKALMDMNAKGKVALYQDKQGVVHVVDIKTQENINMPNWQTIPNKPNFGLPNLCQDISTTLVTKLSQSTTRGI